MTEDFLLRKFEEIHDYIYANDGLSPQQTLIEFTKILFIKIYDENNKLGMFNVSSDEIKCLEDGTDCGFLTRIENLFFKTKSEFKNVFEPIEKIALTDLTLAFIVNKLQSLTLTDSSNDAKGLAFQKFLSRKDKDANGQFFTPVPVIDFCTNFISPNKNETILDPCCGSGGFLYSAYKLLIAKYKNENANIIASNIFGFDINKDIVKIAKMKFLLEKNMENNIVPQNSLNDFDRLKLFASEKNPSCIEGFDNILTNPPFGAFGKISNKETLSRFELGHKWNNNKDNSFSISGTLLNGQSSEILFIEQCLNLLKPNGKMAIVLPNGHFENPSLSYLRSYIKSKAKILGIVTLPQETFLPYGTGIKTSLLFLQKKTVNSIEKDYPIFFSKISKLGYIGNKNASPCYKHDKEGNVLKKEGKEILDEDFSIVLEDYKHFKTTGEIMTKNSFSVMYSDLMDRWDYNFYLPENKILYDKLSKNSKRLGDLVEIVKTRSEKLKSKAQDIDYIELSDINTKSFEIINSSRMKVFELPSRATYELKFNDIITSVAGNSIGTKKHITALVNEDYDGAICTNGFRVLRNPKIDMYYLLYFFSTDLFLNQIKKYRTGAAIPNISDKDFANILIFLPNKTELDSISVRVKEAFDLRKKSASILNNIAL